MSNKYFPINTTTSCQLKWTWSTVYLSTGTTASCHRVGQHPISLDNFDNFHNTPEKIQQRQIMLDGNWPQPLEYMDSNEGCRYCQRIEEAGGQSDRQTQMLIPNLSPKELDIDPTAIVVTPKIVEVFFKNTCNLSCTYCGPTSSSQIENENIKFGKFSKNGLVIEPIRVDKDKNNEYIEKFFSWLELNSNELHRIHTLGGEPLYQKEFYRCMDFFITHPNKFLEFNIVTNLMIDSEKLKKLIIQWKSMTAKKQIKRIDITVSLDCWSIEQEYARWGLKLETIEKNIELLLKEKWLYLNINSTLSMLTLKTFPYLISKINSWRENHIINHHFQSVFHPGFHNPDIVGGDFWKEDIKKALKLMPRSTDQENNAYNYLNGIFSQVQKSCINDKMIVQFITHLNELDRRRGTNWKETFPYLRTLEKYVV